ncbi:MAG: SGNH/GDSL hydrolase family protein [Clostridia bacterium]|nr:SGNH/GDSL hydrolase family protein [Clostridia bacterium]
MRNQTIKEIVGRVSASEHYTIFIVGDSITEGARATSDEATYTAVFARGLAERFKKEDRRVLRYDGKRHPTPNAELLPLLSYGEPVCVQEGTRGVLTVVRSGIGGNTIQRMLNRKNDFIGKEINGRAADLYIIMVGINDALSCDASKFVTPEGFRQNLDKLLDELEGGNPQADVILMTPTYNDTGKRPASHLEPYATEMQAAAKERFIPVIDQHRLWMEHLVVDGENYGQGDWLSGVTGDSCHPSDKGHEAIAKEMLRCLFEESAL